MSRYLEKWQSKELNNLDECDVSNIREALEDKVFKIGASSGVAKDIWLPLWRTFRKIDTFEETKFYMRTNPKK